MYELHQEYRFEVSGKIYTCDFKLYEGKDGTLSLWVEEARKNGQEDYHMGGQLYFCKVDKLWKWDEYFGRQSFDDCDGDADGILTYLNTYPHPDLVKRGLV